MSYLTRTQKMTEEIILELTEDELTDYINALFDRIAELETKLERAQSPRDSETDRGVDRVAH